MTERIKAKLNYMNYKITKSYANYLKLGIKGYQILENKLENSGNPKLIEMCRNARQVCEREHDRAMLKVYCQELRAFRKIMQFVAANQK